MTSELADVGIERMDGDGRGDGVRRDRHVERRQVRQRIAGFVTPEDWAVVLDLSGLTFIDSAGLHGVSVLAELLEERRQRLFLSVPPGGSIARTVELVGLHSVSIYADRDLAIAAAQANRLTSRPYPPDGD